MPIFDVFMYSIQEQIAAMKVKKNPGKPGIFGSVRLVYTGTKIQMNSSVCQPFAKYFCTID